METKLMIGATFSHHHLDYLKIDVDDALLQFNKLGFKLIRVGCYWNEIEREEGKYNFEKVDKIIKFCKKNGIEVVLTIGMKAPRWPEYYLPGWIFGKLTPLDVIRSSDKELLAQTLRFIEKTVRHFKKYKIIKVWQVENEPLDPSGERGVRISDDFLEKEVAVVRELDSTRKILINIWANDLWSRKNYLIASKLADIIGLDLYLKSPVFMPLRFLNIYKHPHDSVTKIIKLVDKIRATGKDLWVTELQAEPWEPGDWYITEKEDPPSFRPTDFKKNLNYASKLNLKVIILWGFEYWLWRKENGNSQYFDEALKCSREFKK